MAHLDGPLKHTFLAYNRNGVIAALKTCLYRVNEIIEDVEDWTVKETLWQCREGLNEQIDNLIKLKKKVNKH